jgi:hypothetical protein
MLKLTQGAANTVTVTLNEKLTISSPTYLLRFVNDETKQENTCIAADTSSYAYRYNQFTITEDATQDRENGTLTLDPPGLWTYYIYAQSSTTNLDPQNTGALVEQGRAYVIGTATTYVRHSATTDQWKVYE